MMFYLEQFFWLVSGVAVGTISSAFLLDVLFEFYMDIAKPKSPFDRQGDGCTGHIFVFVFFIALVQIMTPLMPTRNLETLEECDIWTDRAWEHAKPYGDQFSGYYVCEKATEYVQPCLEWEDVVVDEDRFGVETYGAICWEYGEGKWETNWLPPEEIEEQIFDNTYNWARFVAFWVFSLFSIGYFFGRLKEEQTTVKKCPLK